ncbi:glycoside hydrolase family protein [Edaphobacter aggregans]|uniref:glycoside hydrolase family protein n=1 Tax=Edaphobacter aggregans TaxID=570835 RepID=UPI001FDFF470|nr:hypothetical protein [Edaphobacter aggregans]
MTVTRWESACGRLSHFAFGGEMAERSLGEAGLELTKQFEGCRLEAYQDSVGVWTIGRLDTGIRAVLKRG